MDIAAQQMSATNFVKHVKLVSSKLALFVLHDGICGSFHHVHNKATSNASALFYVQWQNLDEDSFDMLYQNACWAAIPDPIWTTNVPYEKEYICYHPLITILWFVFSILTDLVLNLGFPFFKLTLYNWHSCIIWNVSVIV